MKRPDKLFKQWNSLHMVVLVEGQWTLRDLTALFQGFKNKHFGTQVS